jgi:phosphate transport system permease protein
MNTRKLEEKIFKIIMIAATTIVVGALLVIIGIVAWKGFPALNLDMITKTPEGGFYSGKSGGILNAILGSIILSFGAVVLSFVISLPLVLYLNIYLKKGSKIALTARFILDVLWGVPSIVYGAFGFTLMVFLGMKASLLAGIVTVAILITPIMARAMDEVFRMIPLHLKEAAYSLGSTKFETAVNVFLRQALPGIVTAVLIAFGRGISDAASVLFTAGFTDSLPGSLLDPVATLPLAVFFQLGTPFPEVQQRGYAAALILMLMILAVNIVVRILSKKLTKNIIK